jgi:alpha-1,2-mannosyltransferase
MQRFGAGLGARETALAACLLAEAVALLVMAATHPPLDLDIYAWGGHTVLRDAALYDTQAYGHWFTYPPFAAVSFIPVAALPAAVASLLWVLVSLAATAYVCLIILRLSEVTMTPARVMLTIAVALPLEPVRHTFALGQVNLLLMALVFWDLSRLQRGDRAGMGIGIAAAIKLTPALFVVVLLVTRRFRDAAVAMGTFLVCTSLGFVVAPAASANYWSHLFYDTNRVGAPYISNQSPFGAAARLLGGKQHVGQWYLAIPLAVCVVGMFAARHYARRNDWLGAAGVTGITMLLVSPISWTHHWVWLLPGIAVVARKRGILRQGGLICIGVILVAAPLWWTPHHGGPREYGLHGATSLVANSYLIVGVLVLACLVLDAVRAANQPQTPALTRSPPRPAAEMAT